MKRPKSISITRFSSTQFHPTFNNLPVLKPIPKNRSLQFIYIVLSKHFYLNSLLPIISIYSSVPFLSKRRHFSRLVAKSKPRKPKNTRIEGKNLGRKQQVSQREPFINQRAGGVSSGFSFRVLESR